MNYSVTMTGIIIAVVVPILMKYGFDSACSNQIVNVSIPLFGGIVAWIGRYRKGDVTVAGFRK